MVVREKHELVYDLPRIEETWSVKEWRAAIAEHNLYIFAPALAKIGLDKSFEERRKTGQDVFERATMMTAFGKPMTESEAIFVARIWTMPNHTLRRVVAAHPIYSRQPTVKLPETSF